MNGFPEPTPPDDQPPETKFLSDAELVERGTREPLTHWQVGHLRGQRGILVIPSQRRPDPLA